MKNSTLAELWSVLTSPEREDFKVFVGSPWCNDYLRPEEQVALLDYLSAADAPEKRAAYQRVFDGQPFVDNKLEKLMSATLKSLRRWIFLRQKTSPVEEQAALAQLCSVRGLHSRYNLIVENSRASIAEKKDQDLADYLALYALEYSHTSHLTMHNLKKDDANLNNTLLALDRFYLAARLKNTTLLLAQNLLVPVEMYPLAQHFLPAMIADAQAFPAFKTPLIELYERLYTMAGNQFPGQTDLSDFLEFISRHEQSFSTDTLDTAEIFACNYCTLQYNRAQYQFLPTLFELLMRRLRNGRIYKKNKIRVSDFQLIVVAGLRLGNFEWVHQFLKEHEHRIFGIQRPEEAWNLNFARYLFHIGDFEGALERIAATYEELQYKVSSKVLEIQVLYEQDSPLLDARLDAAKIFMFREKKIPAEKKLLLNNFLDMLKQILNPKTLGNRKRIEKLKEKIRMLNGVAEHDWLTEKLDELLKKAK